MSKVFFIFCLFLAVSLSKTAPVLDEEVDDDYENNDETQDEEKSNENDDDTQDEEKSNENDDDYNDAKAKDDDYDDEEEGNVKRKENEQEDDEEDDEKDDEENDEKDDDDEVEVVEQDRKRKTQYLDEDEGIEEGESKGGTLDDQTVDAAAEVVEDSEGKMAMDKKPGHTDDEDDGDDESDGVEFQDMGKQISKLKKVFNEDMPNEIEELKSNSKKLRDDLDKLNGNLEKFLRDNGIKQGTSVPKSSEDYDYEA